ncbi:MAG: hypothetical protein JXA68_00265 [Ignavibacteriales bacterium]|nr:hypothetical protein [Ignavibacteriales bacterium]
MKDLKDLVVEVIETAIANAFAFENYDGPKSEQDLIKSNDFFANEIISIVSKNIGEIKK